MVPGCTRGLGSIASPRNLGSAITHVQTRCLRAKLERRREGAAANAVASRGRLAKPCASKSISVSTWCPVAGHTNLSAGITICSFRGGTYTYPRAAAYRLTPPEASKRSRQHQQTDGEEHHAPDMFDLDVFQLHLDLVARNNVRWASVSVCPDRNVRPRGVNTRRGRSSWVGRSNRSSTPGRSRSRSRSRIRR